ncbi:MAG TPA: hypothetical protein VF747_01250, partial [Blastocatellia bacterium]
MRLAVYLIASLLVFAASGLTFDLRSDARAVKAPVVQSEPGPKIIEAQLKGKKLIVMGENFAPGADIFINGEKQKTKNDSDNPTTMLIAKKAGKKMPADSVVSIQVINSAGSSSDAFGFFSGRTVTIDDGGKTVELRVGERFLLVLKKDDFLWETTVQDSTVLKKLSDVEVIAGAQGIFEAQRAGQTKLNALGESPCSKLSPPCRMPSIFFELNV